MKMVSGSISASSFEHGSEQANSIGHKFAGKDTKGMPELTYIDMLNQARESENEAIGIYLKVITCAPQEDIPHLTEIAQDENEHLGILSRLLMRYQQDGEITE